MKLYWTIWGSYSTWNWICDRSSSRENRTSEDEYPTEGDNGDDQHEEEGEEEEDEEEEEEEEEEKEKEKVKEEEEEEEKEEEGEEEMGMPGLPSKPCPHCEERFTTQDGFLEHVSSHSSEYNQKWRRWLSFSSIICHLSLLFGQLLFNWKIALPRPEKPTYWP